MLIFHTLETALA